MLKTRDQYGRTRFNSTSVSHDHEKSCENAGDANVSPTGSLKMLLPGSTGHLKKNGRLFKGFLPGGYININRTDWRAMLCLCLSGVGNV